MIHALPAPIKNPTVRRISALLLACVAMVVPRPIAGQQADVFAPNRLVRLTLYVTHETVKGRVVSADSSEVRLAPTDTRVGAGTLVVKRSTIEKIDIATGSRPHVIEGGLIGALLGGVIAASVYNDDCGSGNFDEVIGGTADCLMKLTDTQVTVLGAVAGGVIGGLLGLAVTSTVWTPAPASITMRVVPSVRRNAIALQATWRP